MPLAGCAVPAIAGGCLYPLEFVVMVRFVASQESPEYYLQNAREREHIVSAIVSAATSPQEMLAIMQGASDPDEAVQLLRAQYDLDKTQAIAVLDMQFRRVTRRERARLNEELDGLRVEIADLERAL